MEIIEKKGTKKFVAEDGFIITDIHKGVNYGKEVVFMDSVVNELFIEITEDEAEQIFNPQNEVTEE